MSKYHLYPTEYKMRAIETVVIRDWRFRKQVERSASGAKRMEITDNGRNDLRIDFYPGCRRTDVHFLDIKV